MEIVLTFLAEVDFAFNERPKSVLQTIDVEHLQVTNSSHDFQTVSNSVDSDVTATNQSIAQLAENAHIRSRSIDFDVRHRMRSVSECKRKDRR